MGLSFNHEGETIHQAKAKRLSARRWMFNCGLPAGCNQRLGVATVQLGGGDHGTVFGGTVALPRRPERAEWVLRNLAGLRPERDKTGEINGYAVMSSSARARRSAPEGLRALLTDPNVPVGSLAILPTVVRCLNGHSSRLLPPPVEDDGYEPEFFVE